METISVDGLNARETQNIIFEFENGFTSGAHEVMFFLDSYEEVEESDEYNNIGRIIFNTIGDVSPPSNLTITEESMNDTLVLNWDQPADTSNFIYYILYQDNSGSFTEIAYPDEATYTLPSDDLEDTACFAVSAYYYFEESANYLESEKTSTACINISDDPVLSAPVLDPVEVPSNTSGDELRLSWSSVLDNYGNPATYIIYRLTNEIVSEYNYDFGFPEFNIYETKYIDTYEVDDINTYYYAVQAQGSDGDRSELSNIVYAKPMDSIAPKPPENLTGTPGDNRVSLQWDWPVYNVDDSYAEDLAGFNIYRRTTTASYKQINDSLVLDNLYADDTDLINGLSYIYVVTAQDDSQNNSAFSNEFVVTPNIGEPPSAPSNLIVTSKIDNLVLTWDRVYDENLAGYNIYRGFTSGYYATTIYANVTEPVYTDANVKGGRTYYYVVKSLNKDGQESTNASNEASGKLFSGEVYVISPTYDEPAEINPGNNIIIEYYLSEGYFRIYDSIVVLLEIEDSNGKVVYSSYDYSPRESKYDWDLKTWILNPNFVWNGKGLNSKDVLTGLYSTVLTVIADNEEKEICREFGNIFVEGDSIDVTLVLRTLQGNTLSIDPTDSPDNRNRYLRVVTNPIYSGLIIQEISRTRLVTPEYGHQHSLGEYLDYLCHGGLDVASGVTNSNGMFDFRYRGPEFAGQFAVKVIYRFPESSTIYELVQTFNSRHEGLVEFIGNTDIILVGSTTSHPDNHYCTTSTSDRISILGSEFNQQFNENLVVNDMSLEYGGLFDIGPNYGIYWRPPHNEHRDGKNADITPTVPSTTKWNWLMLRIRQLGSNYIDEIEYGNHLHFIE